jgi:hypothetical protein
MLSTVMWLDLKGREEELYSQGPDEMAPYAPGINHRPVYAPRLVGKRGRGRAATRGIWGGKLPSGLGRGRERRGLCTVSI